ncbi:hypothetical protein N7508_007373 [Penicillium antarcticum]|uniref:uncharacterized protein n=1 Tax=Penicillium antarcticum TaxID=416450 RepID=UPI0023994C39|nr:uncharacterized protein N7508_007373 [Penicillium antarcticum]KAJ5300130.1 hypothetical protein N7508_007373 [Penicillium antarcticum]
MTFKWLKGSSEGPTNVGSDARQSGPATIDCRRGPQGIGHENQRTYTFNDCTFDNTSMVIIGSASSKNETVVLRDAKSGRGFFANGDTDKETFLREFCGKK